MRLLYPAHSTKEIKGAFIRTGYPGVRSRVGKSPKLEAGGTRSNQRVIDRATSTAQISAIQERDRLPAVRPFAMAPKTALLSTNKITACPESICRSWYIDIAAANNSNPEIVEVHRESFRIVAVAVEAMPVSIARSVPGIWVRPSNRTVAENQRLFPNDATVYNKKAGRATRCVAA